MGNVQIIRTASGEELVVMDRRDYDALMSLVSDIDEDEDDVETGSARVDSDRVRCRTRASAR